MVRKTKRTRSEGSPVGEAGPAAVPEETVAESAMAAGAAASKASEPGADQFAAEMGEALRELEDLRDRHLRLAAEFENYRKRTRKEQADNRDRAQADLARRLIASLDDLARVASLSPESTGVEALHEGVELIHRKLRKELEDAGLEIIDADGVRFDPAIHESLLVAPAQTPAEDETVSRVLMPGYRFRGHLLRAAQVEIKQLAAGSGRETEAADIADGGAGAA